MRALRNCLIASGVVVLLVLIAVANVHFGYAPIGNLAQFLLGADSGFEADAMRVYHLPVNERAPRAAAEWEPALGAMVAWPLKVPSELVIEIAKDDRLYVLVGDEAERQEAEAALQGWGVDLSQVTFVQVPQGSEQQWPRDWGPSAVYDAQRELTLIHHRFHGYPISGMDCQGPLLYLRSLYHTGAAVEDRASAVIAASLDLEEAKAPVGLVGGNVEIDGHGTILSTCTLLNENQAMGVSRDDFLEAVNRSLGISTYVILPNYEESGIQHVDCLLKFLDEETILLKQAPESHPAHDRFETIAGELAKLKGPYGRPYKVVRIYTPPYDDEGNLSNYTNSLILNNKVFVGLFGVPEDAQALETYRQAMPGYEVFGYLNPGKDGWNSYDSLHCRTRAVWDPGMLYMSHPKIEGPQESATEYPVRVEIIDYSRAGLIEAELLLRWRLAGQEAWHQVPLRPIGGDSYQAAIPAVDPGSTVEYYLAAADRAGRQDSLPRTAPAGFYSFSVTP